MKDFSRLLNLLRKVCTDTRIVDPQYVADWCEKYAQLGIVHPVSGLPLFFGARQAPLPRTRLQWLFAGPEGARLLWTRDRVDPVHHVWGRHRCVFRIPNFAREIDPFALPDSEFFETQVEFLENAFLQEAELGFLQAHGNPNLQMESATWGRLGPLWSAHTCPDSFRSFFDSHPDSMLLQIPLETVISREGPSICDDPLLQDLESASARREEMAALRRRLGYQVVRERRLVLFGNPESQKAFREMFSFLHPEFLPAGAS